MISYDNYKNRMEKLAKVKGKLHKFRFLICGALAVVIGGSVGLMVAKGSYMSATEMSATTVNFNEPFEITPAKAFLASASSQKIQYAGADGVWTDVKPVKAGKYQARTVTPKLVGYSYSKPVSFEILPLDAQFTIVGESVTYGEVPDYRITLDGGRSLVNGHTIDKSELVFKYDNRDFPTASTAEVSVDESSLKIIDPATGEDYTCCYNVTASSKQLSVTTRKIKVQPVDSTAIYDGKGAVIDNKVTESTLSYLARGDEIRFTTKVYRNQTVLESAINAGTYDLLADGVTIWHGNDEVTALYDVEYLSAKLQIERRSISVSVAGSVKEYDGTALSHAGYAVTEGTLADGHVIQLRNAPSILTVGKLRNECEIAVLDGEEDVKSNYDIKPSYGMLEITARKVKITTASDKKTYDGTPLSNNNFDNDDELDKFTYVADGIAEITDFAENREKNNIFAVMALLNGVNVTANFDFEYDYGTLRINQRPVTITTGNLTAHYNGFAQTNVVATPSDGGKADGGLLASHHLEMSKEFSVTDVTAAGGVENRTEYEIYDSYSRPVTENYDITYSYGRLTITPRPIVVEIRDAEFVYDGDEHFSTDYDTRYYDNESGSSFDNLGNGAGLLGGDKLTVKQIKTKVTNYNGEGDANEVTYGEPNSNYVIVQTINGTLKVVKREIVVTTKTSSWEYDSLEHSDPDYERDIQKTYHLGKNGEKQAALIGEDKLTVAVGSEYGKITNVIESGRPNTVTFVVPNDNYAIVRTDYGTLEITPREIILFTDGQTWIYDGTPHENKDYHTKWNKGDEEGLLNGDELSFANLTITNAFPEIPNEFRIDESATPNYKVVETHWGTLKVTPRPIVVETIDYTWTYDGNEHSAKQLEQAGELTYKRTYFYNKEAGEYEDANGWTTGLLGGETLTLTSWTTITEVGKKDNDCTYSVSSTNYTIVGYDAGELEVAVRYIKVVTPSVEWTYDGIEHYDFENYTTYQVDGNGDRISDTGLIGEDFLEVVADTIAKIVNFGTKPNDTKYTVKLNADGGANYIIYGYDEGTLKIKQRHIIVTTATTTWEYDGADHSDTGYETCYADEYGNKAVDDNGSSDGLLGEDKLTPVIGGATVVNAVASNVENVVVYSAPLFDEAKTNYYLHFVYGKLTVTRRNIKIITEGDTKEYDGTPLINLNYEIKHLKLVNGKYVIDEEEVGLVEGDELDVIKDFPTEYVNFGSYENNPEFYNGNYNISYDYGTLEITKRHVLVTTASTTESEWIYDGQWHSKEAYEKVEYAKGSDETGWHAAEGIALVYNVLNGEWDTLSLIESSVTKVKNATKEPVTNLCEYENSNYEVHYVYGTLTVEKRIVHIKLSEQANWIYGTFEEDETPVICLEDFENVYKLYYEFVGDGSLADGEGLQVNIAYYDSKGEEGVAFPKNVGFYVIKVLNFTVTGGDDGDETSLNDLTNYLITWQSGLLEIAKRPVTVKIEDWDSVYRDALPTEYGIAPVEGSLDFAYGEKLSFALCYKDKETKEQLEKYPVDVGEYLISYWELYVDSDTQGVDNYDLTVIDGILTITARKITITILDQIGNDAFIYGNAVTGDGIQFRMRVTVHDKDGDTDYGDSSSVGLGFNYNGFLEWICLDRVHFEGEGLIEGLPKNVGFYNVFAEEKDFFFMNDSRHEADEYGNYEIVAINPATLEIKPMYISVVLTPFEVSTRTYGDTFVYATGIGNYMNADYLELAYNEKLEVAVRFRDADGNYGTPKNVGEYSMSLDEENCTFYDEFGTPLRTDDDNYGVRNYAIASDVHSYLVIEAKLITVYLLDFVGEDAVTYGEYYFTDDDNPYVIDIGNHKGGEFAPELAYGEQIEVRGVWYNSDKESHVAPRNVGTYTIWVKSGLDGFSPYEIYDENGEPIEEGTKNYKIESKNGTLTIKAKDITVHLSDFSVQYGDDRVYPEGEGLNGSGNYKQDKAPDLSYGDLLKVNGVVYTTGEDEVEHFNVGSYIIGVYGDYTVYDENGNEIPRENYNIDTIVGTLTVLPREVTVKADDKESEYGQDLPAPTFSVTAGAVDEEGNLPYGEKFEVAYYYYDEDGNPVAGNKPVNAGTYEIEVVVTGVKGYPDTGNYDISYGENGVLLISRKAVTVTVTDKECTYGEPLPDLAPAIVGMVGDEVLKVFFKFVASDGIEYKAADNPRLNVGIYTIKEIEEEIYVDGGLVENYEIKYELGKLEVKVREITVQVNGDTVSYGDDYEITYSVTSARKLVDGEELELTFNFKVNDALYERAVYASVYDIIVADASITGGNERVDNYDIDYDIVGKLTINKRKVTVTTVADKTISYGDELDLSDPTVQAEDMEPGELPYGEKFVFSIFLNDKEYKEGEPVVVGKYKLEQLVVSVESTAEEDENFDVSDVSVNYEVSYVSRELTVDKREIRIKLDKEVGWEYGTYHEEDTPTTCEVAEGDELVFGELLVVNVVYYDGEGKNRVDFPKNAGSYVIKAVTFTVSSGRETNNPYGEIGEETKAWNELTNYVIYCEDGLLTISKPELTVKIPKGLNKTYDGKTDVEYLPAIYPEIFKGEDIFTLPYEEEFVYSFTFINEDGVAEFPVNAGTYVIKGAISKVNGADEDADNYLVEFVDGELIIEKKLVTVTVTDKERTYGDPLPELDLEMDGVEGETLRFTFKYVGEDGTEYVAADNPRLNAGKYEIDVNTVDVEGGKEDVGNYNIVPVLGKLTIDRKPVTVTVTDKTRVYGEDLSELDFDPAIDVTLPYGEKLVLTFKFVGEDGKEYVAADNHRLNVGTYAIKVNTADVEGGNGYVDNYDIDYVFGSLEITQATIGEIRLKSDNGGLFEYGEDYDSYITDVEVYGANDERIVVKVRYTYLGASSDDGYITPKDVDSYVAKLDWASCLVYDGDTLIEGGVNNYFEPNSSMLLFSIIPFEVEITIESNGLKYGDALPEIDSYADRVLPYDEDYALTFNFVKDEKTYDREDNKPRLVGSYAISAATITFSDNDGEINAKNYYVTYTENSPMLTIEAREISVALRDDLLFAFGDTVVYPVEAGNYKQGTVTPGLVYGDVLTITKVMFVKLDESGNKVGAPTDEPTDAGRYAIVFVSGSFKVTNGDDDVTYCYELPENNIADGLLVIDSGVLYVKSKDGRWEYDGQWHNVTQSEYGTILPVEGELPEGYEIVIDEEAAFKGVRDVTGENGVRNDTKFKVLYNGVETDNLKVTVKAEHKGVLVIYARKISVKTDSYERPYDGTAFSKPEEYKLEYMGDKGAPNALAVGDSFKVLSYNSVTNVSEGEVTNELTYCIFDGENRIVGGAGSALNNYEIVSETWGKLKITPLKVQIVIDSITDAIYGENISVSFGVYFGGYLSGEKGNLPNGEKFEFETGFFLGNSEKVPGTFTKDGISYTLLDVGTYAIRAKGDVTVKGGEIENYELIGGGVSEGTLKIDVRPISIATRNGGMDGEWVYDGYPHSMPYYDAAYALDGSKAGLLGDDELVLKSAWKTITDVGEEENSIEFDVPSNYRIAVSAFGRLKIVARSITIRTGTIGADGKLIYDDRAHSTTDYEIISSLNLADGQSLYVDVLFEQTDATGSQGVVNTTTFKVMAGSVNVTKNYNISYDKTKPGRIIIMPRPITLKSNDVETTYDGKPHGDDTLIYDASQLVSGHRIEVSGSSSYYDANLPNGMPNIVNYKIVNAAGVEKTDNYEIDYQNGKILIDRATLTVRLATGVSVVYGEDYESRLLLPVTFIADERYTNVKFVPAFILNKAFHGVDTYTATLDTAKCIVTYEFKNTTFNDGLDNYALSVETSEATFAVIEKEITLTLKAGVKLSYGTVAKDSDGELVARLTEGMAADTAYDEKFEYALTYYKNGVPVDGHPVNAGKYTAKIDWARIKVYDKEGNLIADGLSNYELINEGATVEFEITKVNVTVTMNSLGEIKFGESYSYDESEPGNYASATGLQYGEKLKVQPIYLLGDKVLDSQPTFAGDYFIALNLETVEVYSASGVFIDGGTDNYTFECGSDNYGILIIKGITVTVTRQNVSKEYDGAPYALADEITGASDEVKLTYVTSEGAVEEFTLPAGYTLKLRTPFETASKNAGSYDNRTAEYYICGPDGNESGEYIVNTVGVATITIAPKDVTVQLTDWTTVTYDGREQGAQEGKISANGFIPGESLKTVYYVVTLNGVQVRPINAGSYKVTVSLSDTEMSDGNSLDTNYNVIWVNGKEESDFVINARELTVKLSAEDVVYGEGDEVRITTENLAGPDTFNGAFTLDKTLFAVGFYTASLDWDSCTVTNTNGSSGIANYYISDASVTSAGFEVTVRKITVTTASQSWPYDGDEHYNTDYETDVELTYYLDENGVKQPAFVYGDSLTATGIITIVKDYNGDGVPNVVEYEENENYEVTLKYGILRITKQEITVTIDDKTIVYGDELPELSYTITHGELDDGDTIELEYHYEQGGNKDITPVDAGEYVIVGACKDNSNYTVKVVNGKLTIDTKDLTIKIVVNNSYQYGDKSFVDDARSSIMDSADGFIDGESFSAISLAFYLNGMSVSNPKDVATGYEVRFDYRGSAVNGGRGTKGISNYNVIWEEVEGSQFTFEITPKDITLELIAWDDVTYNGEAQDMQEGKLRLAEGVSNNSFEYDEEISKLVYEFFTEGGNWAEPVNVGTYVVKLSLSDTKMSDEGRSALAKNYNISWKGDDSCTFEITPATLTVTLKAMSVDYDGDEHDFVKDGGVNVVEGLCSSDKIAYLVEYYTVEHVELEGLPVNAGTYYVAVNVTVYSKANEEIDVTDNYTVSLKGVNEDDECEFTINERPITVGVADYTTTDSTYKYTSSQVIHAYKGEKGNGFVKNDLYDAFDNGELSFRVGNDVATDEDRESGILNKYEITLVIVEGIVLKNYDIVIDKAVGYLTIRKPGVGVGTGVNGSGFTEGDSGTVPDSKGTVYKKTYDGKPFNVSIKFIALLEDGTPVFTDEELATFTFVYEIKDRKSGTKYTLTVKGDTIIEGEGPVNAGIYEMTLVETDADLDGYTITNSDLVLATLVILSRRVTVTITPDEGYTTSTVYGDFDVDMINKYVDKDKNVKFEEANGDRGLVDELSGLSIVLADGSYYYYLTGSPRFNAGEYQVEVIFDGMENYYVELDSYDFVIKKRTLIIAPVDPLNGAAREYKGEGLYLEGSIGYYALLKDTKPVSGDMIKIRTTVLSVSVQSGFVTIDKVWINDKENDTNYKILTSALVLDSELAGLTQSDFRISMSYRTVTIEYKQILAGERLTYNGTAQKVTIDSLSDYVDYGVLNLPDGHKVELSKSTFTFTEAGVYENWYQEYLQVSNANGRKVACYVFEMSNADDESNAVVVERRQVSVKITVSAADLLREGTFIDSKYSENLILNPDFVEIKGLLNEDNGDAVTHVFEVIKFVIEGKTVFGVTIFADNNGKRKDVIDNYECLDIVIADGEVREQVEAMYIAVSDIKMLGNPVLRISLNGIDKDNLFDNCTFKDGIYYLDNFEYTGLEAGHSVMAVVYNKGGALTIGIVVTKQNSTGAIVDASGNYNVRYTEIDGVNVEVLNYSDFKTLVRTVKVDLTASFNGDGTPIVDEDGRLLNVVIDEDALMKSTNYVHKVEIFYVDGVYKIIAYQENRQSSGKITRSDKRSVYDFIYILPDGMEVEFVKVDVSTFYK